MTPRGGGGGGGRSSSQVEQATRRHDAPLPADGRVARAVDALLRNPPTHRPLSWWLWFFIASDTSAVRPSGRPPLESATRTACSGTSTLAYPPPSHPGRPPTKRRARHRHGARGGAAGSPRYTAPQ